jgi:hypothetical protein
MKYMTAAVKGGYAVAYRNTLGDLIAVCDHNTPEGAQAHAARLNALHQVVHGAATIPMALVKRPVRVFDAEAA